MFSSVCHHGLLSTPRGFSQHIQFCEVCRRVDYTQCEGYVSLRQATVDIQSVTKKQTNTRGGSIAGVKESSLSETRIVNPEELKGKTRNATQ